MPQTDDSPKRSSDKIRPILNRRKRGEGSQKPVDMDLKHIPVNEPSYEIEELSEVNPVDEIQIQNSPKKEAIG